MEPVWALPTGEQMVEGLDISVRYHYYLTNCDEGIFKVDLE